MLDAIHTPETVAALAATVVAVISVLLRAALRRIEAEVEARTRIDMADRQWAKIHSALMTGLRLAASRYGVRWNPEDAEQRAQAIETALQHALTDGAGDSVRERAATERQLRILAEAKIGEVGARIGSGG